MDCSPGLGATRARRHAASKRFADLSGVELEAYRIKWEREARESAEWQGVPHDSIEVVGAQTLDELREVERALAHATDLVNQLIFSVASAREGWPPGGWLDRAQWKPYTTPSRVAKDS